MLSFLRAPSPPRSNTATHNPIIYENGASQMLLNPPGSPFAMTHTMPPHGSLSDGPSVVQPPFHYHIYQSERFRARSGTGNFYIGLDAKPTHVLSSDTATTTASVQSGRYHRFENASTAEPFVVDIQLDPEDYENEARFFRNFLGYLNDCKRSKTAPSIFQLMVFLHSADTPLALPMPVASLETNVGVWASRAFMTVMATIGRAMGYHDNYAEYYEPSKQR